MAMNCTPMMTSKTASKSSGPLANAIAKDEFEHREIQTNQSAQATGDQTDAAKEVHRPAEIAQHEINRDQVEDDSKSPVQAKLAVFGFAL